MLDGLCDVQFAYELFEGEGHPGQLLLRLTLLTHTRYLQRIVLKYLQLVIRFMKYKLFEGEGHPG